MTMRVEMRWACATLLLAAVAGCSQSMGSAPAADMKLVAELRSGGGTGTGGAVAAQPTGTGWATLKGVFKLGGSAPDVGVLSTANKDGAVCGASVPNQTLVVDPSSKGIANIVVYARKVSRVFDDYKKAPGQRVEFDQKKCLFLSHVLGVQTKDTVVIKNSDPIGHNTSLTPPGQQGINPLLPSGGEAEYKFAKAVAMPVDTTCSIHPWMKAYIIARDDPYFAITKPDGSFEIANLPAGEEIEFQVWQEIKGNGFDVPGLTAKGRFKRKLAEGATEDLKVIEIPASALQ
ncbi:MAG TPA: hypothetical protein VG713_11315 [Pirellulales bacterium]|nr:hypothetical protein [Pirellulales bacterium]